MRKLFFILLCSAICIPLSAGYRTTVSQLWYLTGNHDCVAYLVTVWDDHNSDDPHLWTARSSKIILSDACDDGIGGQQVSNFATLYAVIHEIVLEGDCEVLRVKVYRGSSNLMAQGSINLCEGMVNGKKTMKPIRPVSLFPSPIEKELIVEHPDLESGKLFVLSNSGQFLLQEDLNGPNGSTTIALDQLIPGIYLILIQDKAQTIYTERLIKK